MKLSIVNQRGIYMDQFHFKVNLKGMIDLLSNHLYSTPHVFIRELIQNAVDAITARNQMEPTHQGSIEVEIFSSTPPTLYIEDNGIGLTEEEVHQFLSQIGQTSKRDGFDSEDFIGRFGVGLLSCFIVSDEIVLLTRSIKDDTTIEWRGKPDGSYTIKKLKKDMAPGTRIYLQSKPGYEQYFTKQKVKEMIQYYGEFLPYPILFHEEPPVQLNAVKAPWEMTPAEALKYAQEKYQQNYLDAIPLSSSLGEAKGMAYILPYPIRMNAKQTHRVYVKQMLLSEKVEKILPDWAFFVTSILNVNQLRLTASREEFYDDPMLDQVRKELGNNIRDYLMQLVDTQPNLLEKIIQIHYESIKSLAKEDEELYSLFIDWLPFQTTLGHKKMKEIRSLSNEILYTSNLDGYRQISQVAKSQSICVINGAYVHDTELIQQLPKVFPELTIREVNPLTFSQSFKDLTLAEREKTYRFIKLANIILQRFQCHAEIKKFNPPDLPALYTTNEEALFLRTAEHSQEESNDLFASIIEQMTANHSPNTFASLCFNYLNPTIQKAIQSTNQKMLELVIEMLYVQALLLGHYPLKKREFQLLNQGLIRFMETGLEEGE